MQTLRNLAIAVICIIILIYGWTKVNTKQNDESQNKKSEDVTWATQIQDPTLLKNTYQESTNATPTDVTKHADKNASNDENYNDSLKNRYPSTDITKLNDVSSNEASKAISEKINQETIIEKQASDNFYTSFDLDTDNNVLEIISDGNTILENIDELKKKNLVNPEVTQTFINTYPILAASYVTALGTGYIIHNIYFIYDQLNDLKVKVYLLWNDQYGTPQKHLIYTFNFDRRIYEKINWVYFRPENLKTVVPNFHYSAWYQNNI